MLEVEMSEVEKQVYDLLKILNIQYEVIHHEPAHSILDCEHIVKKLGNGVHCKNLFLCNRQETEFYLLLVRFDKKFRTAEISKQIQKSRLSFAKDEYLEKFLNVTPGAVSPMGLIFDTKKEVQLLIDRDLLAEEKIYFHPCVNTASILMGTEDFLTLFLKHLEYSPTYVDVLL